jgi:hypothetical protein
MTEKEPSFFSEQEQRDDENEHLNAYCKERFLPAEAGRHIEWIVGSFKDHFSSLGYKEEPPALISSGVDSSVRFIGSPISVLKPYLLGKQIPDQGVFMRQDCIRTRNADKLLDDDFSPVWGSYFPNMGAITTPERASDGCNEAFDFFEKKLGITPENLLIRINSVDKDLLEICRKRYGDKNLEIDSKKSNYYRHQIGIEGFLGRNCNIALRNSNGEGFSDVANLIIIENEGKSTCLEISIGTTTILKELYGLDHVLDGTPVEGLESVDQKFRRKFEDAIITSSVLFQEGLRPFGQHNRNRILKQYVRSLSYFRAKTGMSTEGLLQVVAGFEARQFPNSRQKNAEIIIEIVKAFENDLFARKKLTADEKKIKKAMELLA